ncbi:MAG TPA: hypothetical protein VJJ70_02370 [Anaerolineales bacterium]|nr:hypothetical protein [Anaerolineales bacterium]
MTLLLAAWGTMTLLPQSGFRDSFLGNFWATVIGVAIGVPIALALNRRLQQDEDTSRLQQSKLETDRRTTQYLKMLQLSLLTNATFLDLIAQRLLPGTVIYSNLDLEHLESTASLKYQLIDDIVLNGTIDSIRFNLRFISRLMDLNVQLSFGPFRAAMGETAFLSEQTAIINRIRTTVPDAKRDIDKALQLVGQKLSQQSQSPIKPAA